MDVSIIIVNWNSLEYTLECVASIEEHVRDLTYEVIVVDNASQDAPCSVLRQAFPWVKLYCLNQNLGFAAGNNFAAAVSSGNKLLFLNPDTKVLGNAIQVMARQLESHPSVGAVGCRLLNRDLTVQLSSVQRFPTITNQLFGLELVQKLLPLSVIWGTKPLCPSESSQLLEVEVVSGACLMVRREVYEAVGHFSTEYFMYAEETDLCSKIRNSGWKVCHVGSAQIVHYGGESTKKVGRSSAVAMRNSVYKMLRKFRGPAYAHAYRMALLAGAATRLTTLLPLLAIPKRWDRNGTSTAFEKWWRIAIWSLSPKTVEWKRDSVVRSPTVSTGRGANPGQESPHP